MASVYIETSIISYLAARPSRDLIAHANQLEAMKWWEQRHRFELLVSTLVKFEAGKGDAHAAARRLAYCTGLRTLEVDDRTISLATDVMRRTRLPAHAEADAMHIALAAAGHADFLLTLNLKHIAAAAHFRVIELACQDHDLKSPVICTPPQLMERPDAGR